MGQVSPPIAKFFESFHEKNAAILIPGCGNAYEAEFLNQLGFTNITLLDIASQAVEILHKRFSGISSIKVVEGDFFTHSGNYHLIIEQTFFCAILPKMRKKYVRQSHDLLKPQGRIVGVLFNKHFGFPGPPFGGHKEEYEQLFASHFKIVKMEKCYNSIEPRSGSEIFINLKRK